MGKGRKSDRQSDESSPLTERIKQLCDLLWGGNRSRMARDLEISHPVISRVLAGQQPPPGKLLEGMAKWPGLNLKWLFAGEGEPLGDRGLGGDGGHFAPIAKSLLPGEPAHHPEGLTGTSLPVATAYFTPTVYWFRLPNQGIAETKKTRRIPPLGTRTETCDRTRVKAGDYLLIETSPRWTCRPEAYRGRLCVLRDRDRSTQILGLVARDNYSASMQAGKLPYVVETFGIYEFAVLDAGSTRAARDADPEVEPILSLPWNPVDPHYFFRDDVVGVCVLLLRLLDELS
jgi:hypothetical protein